MTTTDAYPSELQDLITTTFSRPDLADLCLRLHERLYPQIAADAGLLRVYQDIEIPVRDILFRMERTGVLINTELLKQQSQEIGLFCQAYLAYYA